MIPFSSCGRREMYQSFLIDFNLHADRCASKWRVVLAEALCGAAAGAEAAADPQELRALEVAVRGAALERSMERSRLLAAAAEARVARTQQRTAAGIKAKVTHTPPPLFGRAL